MRQMADHSLSQPGIWDAITILADIAIEPRVGRLVDHTHPARAEFLDEAVMLQLLADFDGHGLSLHKGGPVSHC